MNPRIVVVLFFSSLLLFFSSCRENHYKVNISSSGTTIKIKRLERDLFEPDPSSLKDSISVLKARYRESLQLFSSVIKAGDINSEEFGDLLTVFCTDRLNTEVYGYVQKVYPDVSKIEDELSDAFSHYRYYFPGKVIPGVFTCITGFNYSFITYDSIIGISLDKYLGSDCDYYPRLQIYSYISARMNPENLVPDCIYAWGSGEWDYDLINYKSENVLSHMIHQGKLRYFEKCMIPEVPDTLLFGFSDPQLQFCQGYENQMWTYLIENDLLFSTDNMIIRKLTGEAPFTSYFSNESPGQAAIWLGFRIVESYMKKNREVKLEDLMNNADIQAILDGAKYNP